MTFDGLMDENAIVGKSLNAQGIKTEEKRKSLYLLGETCFHPCV